MVFTSILCRRYDCYRGTVPGQTGGVGPRHSFRTTPNPLRRFTEVVGENTDKTTETKKAI